MFALFLLLQAAAPDIVVTGERLVEEQAKCARGECTPLRDARATIALAEQRFRSGEYVHAKGLLAAAISRNKDKGADAPRAVAAIYEAMATVSLHEGDQDDYRRAVAGQDKTLRDNLPADDVAVQASATALGDMWIKLGRYRQAESTFRGIEEQALAEGQAYPAMMAGMKRVWLAGALGKMREARAMLDALEQRQIAQEPGFRTALRVVRLRLAVRAGDEAEITRLAGTIAADKDTPPILIWQPPYPSDAIAEANNNARAFGWGDVLPVRSSDVASIQWVDVGFWVRPDGRIEEAEILRGSRSPAWAPAILKQVEGRRYVAKANLGEEGAPGSYRIERVTRKNRYETPLGSNIRRRISAASFEVLDLTASEAATPPPGE
jgi:tetratricopeptide (TPR) repeat protein